MKEIEHTPYAKLRWVSPNGMTRIVEFVDPKTHAHFPYALEWMVGDSLGATKWQTIPLMNLGGDKKVQIRKALKDVLAAAISNKPKENDND